MKPNTLVSIAAGLALAAAIFVAVEATRSSEVAEAALAAANQKRAARERELLGIKARITAAEEANAALQTSLDQLTPAKPKPPVQLVRLRPAAPTGAGLPNPRDLLTNEPQLQALWLKSGRSAVLRHYNPLFTTLGLSPEQIAKFQDNVIHQQEQLMDLAGARQSGGDAAKSAIDALRQKVRDEFETAQAELLGPAAVKQWRDYERCSQVRSMIDGFAGASVLNGTPIAPEQANRLVEVFATATRDYARGGRADPATIDWDTIDARLQPILSPSQLTLFKTTAPLGNSWSRWASEMDAAVAKAQQAEAKQPPPSAKIPGS